MHSPVTIDGQEYLCPTWSDMGEVSVALAGKILDGHHTYDRIVGLAQGGLSWLHQLQDLLVIPQASSIQIKSYKGINETIKRPIVIQSLPVSIVDEEVLLFDDVADSGESLMMAKDYLSQHGAKNITTVTMFYKPWSKITPDFYDQTTKAWLIFPHDSVEHIPLLAQKWQVSRNALTDRLYKIGLEKSIVDFYLAANPSA